MGPTTTTRFCGSLPIAFGPLARNMRIGRGKPVMAEIKSTLELVLEKTRHLTLSEEEKREQEVTEFRQKMAGMVQRYLDETLTVEGLEREMDQMGSSRPSEHRRMFLEEALRRLDLANENKRLLTLLNQCGRIDTGPITVLLNGYRTSLDDSAREYLQALKEKL